MSRSPQGGAGVLYIQELASSSILFSVQLRCKVTLLKLIRIPSKAFWYHSYAPSCLRRSCRKSAVMRREPSPAYAVEDLRRRYRPLLRLLGLTGLKVRSVIGALDLLDHLLHLLALLLPLCLGHVLLLVEHGLVGLAVATAKSVPESGVLTIVVVEGQVVDRVASSAVDDRVVAHKLAIVNQNCPEVDEYEQADEGDLLQRENEDEDVVWHTLSEAVERVEGVGGEWGGHDPLVVRLVQTLVDERVVKTSVDPVDAEVGKHEEQWELDPIVQGERSFVGLVVEFAVSADLGDHKGRKADGHQGHGLHGLLHFEFDLVAEVLGVLESLLVKDEEVRQGSENKVKQYAKQPVPEAYG